MLLLSTLSFWNLSWPKKADSQQSTWHHRSFSNKRESVVTNATPIEIQEADDDEFVEIQQVALEAVKAAAPARDQPDSDKEIVAVGGQIFVWLKYFMMDEILSKVVLLAAPWRSLIWEATKILHLKNFPQENSNSTPLQNQLSQDLHPSKFMKIMTKHLQVQAEAVENMANINSTSSERGKGNPSKGFAKLSKVTPKCCSVAVKG